MAEKLVPLMIGGDMKNDERKKMRESLISTLVSARKRIPRNQRGSYFPHMNLGFYEMGDMISLLKKANKNQ